MVSPARSISRFAMAFSLAASLTLGSRLAVAQERILLIRDTEIESILADDAAPILNAAGIDPANVEIILIGGKDFQAFAGPGVIGVYTGLIMQTETPNELQGVMGHEVGHLASGHSARSGEMNRAGMTPFLLTMGLGVLAALAGSPEGAVALGASAQQFGTLGALGYSREQESRADQAGATLLERAGLSGRGLAEFFDNFRYQEVFDEARRYAYFRSHPISSDRMQALRGRVERLSNFDRVDSPEAIAEHEIMKAKLIGFMSPQSALITYDEKDTSYPARYARAIAYYQLEEPNRALRMIDALLEEQPENPYLWELKGQILFEFASAKEAEAPQRRSVELMPEAPLLRFNLAQTLIALNDKAKINEGITELRKSLTQEQDNVDAWRLLAEAYDRRGDDGRARLATAEYNFYLGDMRQARIFGMRARDMLTKDSPEWRRATDIVMVSGPSRKELRDLARDGSIRSRSR